MQISEISAVVRSGCGKHILELMTNNGVDPHMRDHDIQLVYKGRGKMFIGDRVIPLEKGDIITIFPGESFCVESTSNEQLCRYYIHMDFFSGSEERLITPTLDDGSRWPRLVHMVDDVDARLLCVDIILQSLDDHNPAASRIIANGKLLTLIGLILKRHMDSQPDIRPQHMKSRRGILKAQKHIMENYAMDLSLETLAAVAGLSPSYFGSVFKAILGKSPIDYLTDYRISLAKKYLLETGYNVCQVANLVGYEDVYYFSSVFKHRTGISPSQFMASIIVDE